MTYTLLIVESPAKSNLTQLPVEIGHLIQLTTLYLIGNQLTEWLEYVEI